MALLLITIEVLESTIELRDRMKEEDEGREG